MIVVTLPTHLRTLARVDGDVALQVPGRVTQSTIIDALEAAYPMLRGAVRDPATGKRRRLVRFFACGQDVSHDPPDTPLPPEVAEGTEPYMIIGAIAGG